MSSSALMPAAIDASRQYLTTYWASLCDEASVSSM